MNYRYEVQVNNDPEWYGNSVVFLTWDEADTAATAKLMAWTSVKDVRVVETDAPANCRCDKSGRITPIPAPPAPSST